MRSGEAVEVWSGGVWSVPVWLGGQGWSGWARRGLARSGEAVLVRFGAVWRGWAVEAL